MSENVVLYVSHVSETMCVRAQKKRTVVLEFACVLEEFEHETEPTTELKNE